MVLRNLLLMNVAKGPRAFRLLAYASQCTCSNESGPGLRSTVGVGIGYSGYQCWSVALSSQLVEG